MSLQVQTFGPSGYTSLPKGIISDNRTGQAATPVEVGALCGVLPWLGGRSTDSLGQTPWMIGAILGAFVAHGGSAAFATGYSPPLVIESPAYVVVATTPSGTPWTSFVVKVGRSAPSSAARQEPALTPLSAAEELRAISGLQPAKLAELFGVSRTTFYKWMKGAAPRDQRFQHLVDVLAHAKEAQRKLSASIDLSVWLRAPMSAGGRSPLDLLRERRFSTFRGLLVRARSAEMTLSQPLPSVVTAPLNRDQFAVARERINPSPRVDPRSPRRKRGA